MSQLSSLYLTLTRSQQKLLGDLIGQGVRAILKDGQAIDAAMRTAESRFHQGLAGLQPALRVEITISVVEYDLHGQPLEPGLTVEGGAQ